MILHDCFLVERAPYMDLVEDPFGYAKLHQRWIGGIDENGKEVNVFLLEGDDGKPFGVNGVDVDGEEVAQYTDVSIQVTIEKKKYIKYTFYLAEPIEMYFE